MTHRNGASEQRMGVVAIWVVMAGICVAMGLAWWRGVAWGLGALVLLLLGLGWCRVFGSRQMRDSIAVRSRIVDGALYLGFAAALVFLGVTAPQL